MVVSGALSAEARMRTSQRDVSTLRTLGGLILNSLKQTTCV